MATGHHTNAFANDARPLTDRLDEVTRIVRELRDETERLYVLASCIEQHLCPDATGNSPEPSAFRLAEVAAEIAGDTSQWNYLNDLLGSVRDRAALDEEGVQ